MWMFGMKERKTNKQIYYPVGDRTKETLVPLIKRHTKPGSTVISDGWSSYLNLNQEGFCKHFTVNHKKTFKQHYKNRNTNEVIAVHTNAIEGSWQKSKQYFQ